MDLGSVVILSDVRGMNVAVKPERAPAGPVGRFAECPANGDEHPELLALEIRRTWDKNGKERFTVVCPLCYARIFLNHWAPERSSHTIVWAETRGLHPVGITLARKTELLKELGLKPLQDPGQLQPVSPWPPRPPAPGGYAAFAQPQPQQQPQPQPQPRVAIQRMPPVRQARPIQSPVEKRSES